MFLSQSVMEQFNPGLRNLVNLGKNYEKSVTGEYLDSTHHFTLETDTCYHKRKESLGELSLFNFVTKLNFL